MPGCPLTDGKLALGMLTPPSFLACRLHSEPRPGKAHSVVRLRTVGGLGAHRHGKFKGVCWDGNRWACPWPCLKDRL